MKFSDIVDLARFKEMMNALLRATGLPHGLIDLDNTILSGAGWQRICTDFHRVNPVSACRCQASDHYIADHLRGAPFIGYRCENGLMDYATPVVIDGEHLATIFCGQFLHEPPDLDFFRRQARDLGFDEEEYLAALAEVPVIPREQAEATMVMMSHLAGMLASAGYDRMRLRRSEEELRALNASLADEVAERTRQLQAEVTAERATEAALRSERDFSRAIIESLPGIFYLIDTEGRIVLSNRNFQMVVGYSSEELAGFPAISLFRGEARDLIGERIARVFTDGRAEAEADLTTRDGRDIPYYFSGLRVELNGTPYLAGLGIDVTEQQRARRELEDKSTALAQSNADLEQFAYVASHDLREPLRMISSYIGLLERRYAGQFTGEAAEFLAFAKDGALRMDHLVLALLDYSRIGRGGFQATRLDSAAAARDAVANLRVAIADSGAGITIADDLPMVTGNPDELTRLFQNLIGNALKYSRPEAPPAVQVTCRRSGRDWEFAVADNGIGIPPEHRDRVFQIFQRLHTRQQYDGTGIGLAIARKIVDRHGGKIWAEDNPAGGTTFRFTLPRTDA